MRGKYRLVLFLFAGMLPLPAPAQSEKRPAPSDELRDELEGFWPSEKIIDLVLTRWADEAGGDNELDEQQIEQLRERMLNRWPKFLKENRSKIQPVVNEFIEMRLEMKPPDKERVQDWAERASPVFDMFREQISHGIEDFRETLNPLQKAKFEAKVLEFSAGMQVAEAKLKQWKRGEFEDHEFWDPPRAERRRRRDEEKAREQERHAAEARQKDQITEELDRWDQYVAETIRTYEFDDAQRTTSQSCLKEIKERAATYRERNREQIAKLEDRVVAMQQRNEEMKNQEARPEEREAKKAGADAELEEVKDQLTAAYGPIDEMFQELKRRVEGIPTREQRERVERAKLEEQRRGPDEAPAVETEPRPSKTEPRP